MYVRFLFGQLKRFTKFPPLPRAPTKCTHARIFNALKWGVYKRAVMWWKEGVFVVLLLSCAYSNGAKHSKETVRFY